MEDLVIESEDSVFILLWSRFKHLGNKVDELEMQLWHCCRLAFVSMDSLMKLHDALASEVSSVGLLRMEADIRPLTGG